MSDINRYGAGGTPARWQDWVSLVLAVWLFISPWVLGFAIGATAAGAGATGIPASYPAWDAWIFGLIAAIVVLSAMYRPSAWQEWITLLIGIWLFVAPWVLKFSTMANAAWDSWFVGAVLFLVALTALSVARGAVSYAHAGQKPLDRNPPRL